MNLSKTTLLGNTFLFNGSFSSLLHKLDSAFFAQEVDVNRVNAPFMFLCRALRQHQVVMLDVCIFDNDEKYLVSMRCCGGDRAQAAILVYEIAAAAGLCAPVVKTVKELHDPTVEDVARYTSSLNDPNFKEQMKGVCAAANLGSVLKAVEGKQLAARIADLCLTSTEPLLRLAAMSAAVSLVQTGAEARVFAEAARAGLDDPEPLLRIQATHLIHFTKID
jgi:hypothetical protein